MVCYFAGFISDVRSNHDEVPLACASGAINVPWIPVHEELEDAYVRPLRGGSEGEVWGQEYVLLLLILPFLVDGSIAENTTDDKMNDLCCYAFHLSPQSW